MSLIGVLLLALPNPAFANWWIVRSSDKQLTSNRARDKRVTKIGEEVYPEEAEAAVKRLCKE